MLQIENIYNKQTYTSNEDRGAAIQRAQTAVALLVIGKVKPNQFYVLSAYVIEFPPAGVLPGAYTYGIILNEVER